MSYPLTAEPDGDCGCMMHVQIDAARIHQFRQLVMATCGELMSFMRVQPFEHATRLRVWIFLKKSAIDRLMDTIMRTLPNAEFGPIKQSTSPQQIGAHSLPGLPQ